MANENSIKVDLEFQLNQGKLKQTLGQAGKEISRSQIDKKAWGNISDELRSDARMNAGFEANQRARDIANTRNSDEERHRRMDIGRRWRKRAERREEDQRRDRSNFGQRMSALALPMSQPTNPWALYWGGKQAYSAFNGTKTGQNAVGAVGLSGSGGAVAATAGLLGAAIAIGAAVKLFHKAVQEFYQSVDRARHTYSATMQNGMGLQMNNRLNLAGNVLGINPQEVWQFGRAFGYVDERLKNATKILTETNPVLTMTGWKLGILKADMEALWAKISYSFAPAAQNFIDWVDKITKSLTDSVDDKSAYNWEAAKAFRVEMSKTTPDFSVSRDSSGAKPEDYKFSVGKNSSTAKDVTAEYSAKFIEFLKTYDKTGKFSAQQPSAFMKRMPASEWERMGLVIGGGGGVNYAKMTAEQTKLVNQAVTKIAEIVPAIKAISKVISFISGGTLPSLP